MELERTTGNSQGSPRTRPCRQRSIVSGSSRKTARGGWSEPGLTLPIHVLPAWWNTWQFRTVWITSLILLTWLVYRRRLHRMKHDFNVRLEERLDENAHRA